MNPLTKPDIKLALRLIAAFLFSLTLFFPRHGRAEQAEAPVAVQDRTAESLLAALDREETAVKPASRPVAEEGSEALDAAEAPAEAVGAVEAAKAKAEQAPASKEKSQKHFLDEAAVKKESGFLEEESAGKTPWLKGILAFLFVSSLIIVLGSLVNGKLKGPKAALKNQRAARVVQTLSLGMKRQVAIVDYEGTRLLIALNGNNMQLLYAREPKAADKFVQEQAATQAAASQPRAEAAESPVAKTFQDAESPNFAAKIRQAMQSMKPLSQPFPYSGKAAGRGLNRYS